MGLGFDERVGTPAVGKRVRMLMNKPLAQAELLAHSLNEAGKRQTLAEHLKNVAALAETFASGFGEEATARFVALVHDIGKAKGTWQERLMQLEAGLKPAFDEVRSDHKMAGAAHAYSFSAAAALIVAGHHGAKTSRGCFGEVSL